jgi:hypothetical protein
MDTENSPTRSKIAHTIPETVRASGISRSAIYLALKTGALHARKYGTRTIIEDAELRRFIANLPAFGPRDQAT